LDYCSGEVKLVPRNWSRVEKLELVVCRARKLELAELVREQRLWVD
jgi:hypothetical protein